MGLKGLRKVILFILAVAFLGIHACAPSEPVEIKDGYLSGADDAKIYYKVMGEGQDSLVVVHGGPGAGINSVIPAFRPLAENFVLVFYDQRGGGRSTLPADTTKLKPRYFVEDLEAVRTHFGLGKMNVITHSFGSILVAEYAKKYPARLRRVAFHGATGPDLLQELNIRKEKAKIAPSSPDTMLSNRASELLGKLLEGKASDPVKACREYEAINRKLATARGDTVNWVGTTCDAPPESIRYYYQYTAQLAPRYYNQWNFTAELGQVTAPLLVVWGKKDSLMIPAQKAWVEAIPNGRLLLVPRAEKGAISDNPEFVLPALEAFFNGQWPPSAESL